MPPAHEISFFDSPTYTLFHMKQWKQRGVCVALAAVLHKVCFQCIHCKRCLSAMRGAYPLIVCLRATSKKALSAAPPRKSWQPKRKKFLLFLSLNAIGRNVVKNIKKCKIRKAALCCYCGERLGDPDITEILRFRPAFFRSLRNSFAC